MTTQEKIKDWSYKFGLEVNNKITKNRPDPIDLDLILEEVDELKEAYTNGDVIEQIDAIDDIMWVCHRYAMKLGFDVDKAMEELHKSNMSKLCYSLEEVKETKIAYMTGVHPDKPGVVIDVEHKEVYPDQYAIYNTASGKILKSINFKKPDYSKFL